MTVQVEYEVYLLTAPGYWYIGSTKIGAEKRFLQHLAGRGGGRTLYEKLQELGRNAFTQTVLEEGFGNPTEAEQRWYDKYLSDDPGESLNGKRPGGYPRNSGWNRGVSPSPDTIAKRQATWKANRKAKTACSKGHRYERWNIPFPGTLRCRQCNIDRCQARRQGVD